MSSGTLHSGMVNISAGADRPVVRCVGCGLEEFFNKNWQCRHHENQLWIHPVGVLHLVADRVGLFSDNFLQTAHKSEFYHQL